MRVAALQASNHRDATIGFRACADSRCDVVGFEPFREVGEGDALGNHQPGKLGEQNIEDVQHNV